VRLVACRSCHTQYDLAEISAARFACRCGAAIENRAVEAHDAPVVRCGSCGAGLAPEGGSCTFCGSAVVRGMGTAGPVCPECFARTPAGSRFCTACGVAFRPEPLQVEARELPCPACSVPMRTQAVGGVAVGQCGSCQGLWIPEGGLEDLVRRARETRREAAPADAPAPAPRVRGGNPAARPVAYRRCPECDAYMQRRNFQRSSGVIVDVCHRHGTWLDADELEQIAGYVLSRGQDADFVAGRPAAPAVAPGPTPADAAFARILVEHRTLERRTAPDGPSTLLDLLVGLLR
jgi:Zn-finger nucleic acid-binding protein